MSVGGKNFLVRGSINKLARTVFGRWWWIVRGLSGTTRISARKLTKVSAPQYLGANFAEIIANNSISDAAYNWFLININYLLIDDCSTRQAGTCMENWSHDCLCTISNRSVTSFSFRSQTLWEESYRTRTSVQFSTYSIMARLREGRTVPVVVMRL